MSEIEKIKKEKIDKPLEALKQANKKLTKALDETAEYGKKAENCWIDRVFNGHLGWIRAT